MKSQSLTRYSILLCMLILPFFGKAQSCDPLTRPQLKEMLIQLGYAVKDIVTTPGKEKYSIAHNQGGLDIPVGYELSPSTSYIWLTVNLGSPKDSSSAQFNLDLLRQNSKIQPCFFYFTDSGRLMMGLPVENRGVTNAILRKQSDKIVSDVSKTSEFWKR